MIYKSFVKLRVKKKRRFEESEGRRSLEFHSKTNNYKTKKRSSRSVHIKVLFCVVFNNHHRLRRRYLRRHRNCLAEAAAL